MAGSTAKYILKRPGAREALIFATLAAILCVHGSAELQWIGRFVLGCLAVWSLLRADVGFVCVFPASYTIAPAPARIGISEALFAALLVAGSAGAAREHWTEFRKLIRRRATQMWLAVGTAFLVVNLTVATWNVVPRSDWMRGLVPFLFLPYLTVVYLNLRGQRELASLWFTSLGLTAFLFASHVIVVFIEERLWEPNWYLYDNGRWIRVLGEEVGRFSHGEIHQFAIRVTLRLQASTDIFVPLGIPLGLAAFVFASRRRIRYPMLWLGLVSVTAVVLTYTRSMLLACALVSIGLGALAVVWRRMRRFAAGFLLLCLAGFATIEAANLESIYLNRLLGTRDDNVTTRLEEYRIAWDLFQQRPFLGHGLGVKHLMRFATGFGEVLEQRVAYIHNWPLYMLMVGGIPAFSIYTWILCGPLFRLRRIARSEAALRASVSSAIALLALYGLFFAVFRLITFNLLLAGIWGLLLAGTLPPGASEDPCAESPEY